MLHEKAGVGGERTTHCSFPLRLAGTVLAAGLTLVSAKGAEVTGEIESIALPPLQVDGRAARAHTQGLEIVGSHYYVTARLEISIPKRAILLRTRQLATGWDVWDLTSSSQSGDTPALDHPGGMQSDGKRLWIPVGQSVRGGRSVIRALTIEQLIPGQSAGAEFEFPVSDHIGAIAVAANQRLILGANWDTEVIYVWNFEGKLQRTLSGTDLKSRNLGTVPGRDGRAGVAVQDWKVVGDRLFASGLFGNPVTAAVPPKSRLLVFRYFLEPEYTCQSIVLPIYEHTELGREAMALSDAHLYFLPEDLGASNRVFRTPLVNLLR